MTQQHFKKKYYAIFLITLVIYVGTSCISYFSFYSDVRETQEFEKINAEVIVESNLIHELTSELGYGAFVHNFKNYILRRDEHYYLAAVKNFQKIGILLDKLENINQSSIDYVKRIDAIRQVTQEYYQHLLNVKSKLKSSNIANVDEMVKMNDRPAMEAIRWIKLDVQRKHKELKKAFTSHTERMLLMLNLVTLGAVNFFIFFLIFVYRKIMYMQNKSDEEKQNRIHLSRIQEIQEMSGTLAHEINNPLAIILGAAGSIKKHLSKEGPGIDKAIAKTETIVLTVDRISSIIQSMKNLSHKSESRTWQSFLLSDALSDVMNLSRDRFKHNEVAIDVLGDSDIPLFGQRNQIGQVLLNLFNNSFDAIKNQPEKWIKVEIEKLEQIVEIYVVDSGPRLSAEVVDKLMVPFFTTKSIGKGTGIGLSISKTILKDHDGKIEYIQASPHTTFKITLPLNTVVKKLSA